MPGPSVLVALGGFVRPAFLARGEALALAHPLLEAVGTPAEVYEGEHAALRLDERRATELALPASVAADLDARVAALAPALATHFDRALGPAEPLGVLRYEVGGHHRPHHDTGRGAPASARVVSVVIFLNDATGAAGFTGGALRVYGRLGPGLEDLALDIEAEAGTLLAFPSSWLHEVATVTAGVRLTAVTWFAGANGAASRG
ncbi:MAG: 2OG-Fe(II) oxygenase [Vicinamibacterales bacterium]